VNSVDALLDDDHIRAVGLGAGVVHPTEGRLRMPRVPVEWADHRPGPMGPAPRLGEHTVPVLRERGFGDAEINAMLDDGAAKADRVEGLS
jgi:crotonobetainyl-CoA:carnitine CoA-transferase CaiB-like acyl-CoA transferase